MSVKFKSTRSSFNSKNRQFKEIAMSRMAQDIEILIKTGSRTPVKSGELKAKVRHTRTQNGYRVESNSEHSAVQELGSRRGARPFKNYTKPGSGKGWFKEAILKVEGKKDQYIKDASRSVKL